MQRKKLFTIFLIIVLLTSGLPTVSKASPASAGDPSIRLALSDYIPPAMTTLAVQGPYAYVGAGPSLLVIDISDPDHPQRVAYRLLPAMAKRVAVSTGRVYVLTDADPYHQGDNHVLIFNIDNPLLPFFISDYGPANIDCLAVTGEQLFLGSNEGLSILNLSDPRQPVLLSNLPYSYPDSGYVSAIAITGSKAVLSITTYEYTDEPPELWVLDISDPAQSKITAKLQGSILPMWITGLSMSADLLALAGYRRIGYSYPEFDLIDLSDPAHPVKIGSSPLTSLSEDPAIVLLDHTVYVAAQNHPILAYDISDPTSPVLTGQGEDPVWGLAAAGGLVYVAAGAAGLAIYDSQGLGSLLKRGALLGIGSAEDVAVQGNSLYIADGGVRAYAFDYASGGLAIATVQPPGQTEVIGKLMQGGHGAYVEVEGERSYLISGSCFLRYTNCSQTFGILDVSDPQVPSLLGAYMLEKFDPGQAYAELVSIQNHLTYINTNASASDQKGLAVMDISGPSTPTLLSLYQPPIPPHEQWGSSSIAGAAITGTYGLLSISTQVDYVYTNSLQVFDVSNPFTFTKLTSYPLPDPGRVFLQGLLGFVVDRDQPWPGETLKFMDLSQLPQVKILSSKTFPNTINDVAYDGRYAFVADGEAGLRVIDLADLTTPREVFAYDTIGNAVAVAVDGDWVYLADQAGGLLIFRKVTPQFYLPYLSLAAAH
jgi:hypothetical protein